MRRGCNRTETTNPGAPRTLDGEAMGQDREIAGGATRARWNESALGHEDASPDALRTRVRLPASPFTETPTTPHRVVGVSLWRPMPPNSPYRTPDPPKSPETPHPPPRWKRALCAIGVHGPPGDYKGSLYSYCSWCNTGIFPC